MEKTPFIQWDEDAGKWLFLFIIITCSIQPVRRVCGRSCCFLVLPEDIFLVHSILLHDVFLSLCLPRSSLKTYFSKESRYLPARLLTRGVSRGPMGWPGRRGRAEALGWGLQEHCLLPGTDGARQDQTEEPVSGFSKRHSSCLWDLSSLCQS